MWTVKAHISLKDSNTVIKRLSTVVDVICRAEIAITERSLQRGKKGGRVAQTKTKVKVTQLFLMMSLCRLALKGHRNTGTVREAAGTHQDTRDTPPI